MSDGIIQRVIMKYRGSYGLTPDDIYSLQQELITAIREEFTEVRYTQKRIIIEKLIGEDSK